LDNTFPIYATAVSIGLVHGLEPGHGWPVAAVYALKHRNRWWFGVWAAFILAAAHLVSSFAAVLIFVLADHWLGLNSLGWIGRLAGVALLIMGGIEWWRGASHRHDASHPHHHLGDSLKGGAARGSLMSLVAFAFALGFLHEEEFAILALSAGRTNPWLLMTFYALAVTLSLIALTCLAMVTFRIFEERLAKLDRYLPRISAVVLVVMGLVYIFGWI
jgi:cytochrome c biogenesis protein CcdA